MQPEEWDIHTNRQRPGDSEDEDLEEQEGLSYTDRGDRDGRSPPQRSQPSPWPEGRGSWARGPTAAGSSNGHRAPPYIPEESAEPKKAAAVNRQRTAALTGDLSPFPTLGMQRSRDPALNMAFELHARFITFTWKTLLLGLRAKDALGSRWERNCRWLSLMLGREAASIFGHMRAASRALRGPKGPPLFR